MRFSTQTLKCVTADCETEENFRTFCSPNLETSVRLILFHTSKPCQCEMFDKVFETIKKYCKLYKSTQRCK